LAAAKIDRGAVLHPDGIDVARLIAYEIALAGGGKHVGQLQRAGQLLVDIVYADIEARADRIADPPAQVAVKAEGPALRMVAVPVRTIGADCAPIVDVVVDPAIGGKTAQG